ncbi:MAG: hypothetical protein IJ518_04135 [Clostridia bacterium]|nr:hypothetical protein [Clostridia bacterium]
MTKKLAVFAIVLSLLLSVFCVAGAAEEAATSSVTWTNGTTEEWAEYGYTRITSSDTRGYISTPNLDEGPYYMVLGMEKLMPAGAQEKGGRWAQLHISSSEHASNDTPAGDLYISFPNANARPRNITVYTRTDGEKKLYGVHFAVRTGNLVKFAKEKDENGTDVLSVYINGTLVFQGADQLSLFEGENLHFTAIGNEGEYDTFKDYPLFVDMDVTINKEPATAFYTGPKWGRGEDCVPQKDIMVTYTANGEARMELQSSWDDGIGALNQSIWSTFLNYEKQFDVFFTVENFNYDSWYFLNFRPGQEGGFANDDGNSLNIEVGSGPAYSIWYRTPNYGRVDLLTTEMFEQGQEMKFHFEVAIENRQEVAKIYINDVLKVTTDNMDVVNLLKYHTIKMIHAGSNSLPEIPVSTLVRIDNTPEEFSVVVPGEEEEEDPYKDLVLTTTSDDVAIKKTRIGVRGRTTVAQLKAALKAPEGTVIYIMDANGDVAEDTAVIDSTYSVMMLLDDEYETYVRSYLIVTGPSNSGNGGNSGNSNVPLSPPTGETSSVTLAILLVVVSAVALAVVKRAKAAQV